MFIKKRTAQTLMESWSTFLCVLCILWKIIFWISEKEGNKSLYYHQKYGKILLRKSNMRWYWEPDIHPMYPLIYTIWFCYYRFVRPYVCNICGNPAEFWNNGKYYDTFWFGENKEKKFLLFVFFLYIYFKLGSQQYQETWLAGFTKWSCEW